MRYPNTHSFIWLGNRVLLLILLFGTTAWARDLPEVRASGVLRHLGIPYANFVTGSGDGLDVEMMQLFAHDLGVRYEYVETTWADVLGDLLGRRVRFAGNQVEWLNKAPVRGDLIANGLTVLSQRQQALDYSTPTFPSGVWLIARADSPLKPIQPSDDSQIDIKMTLALLAGHSVLVLSNTCLDPKLHRLDEAGAAVRELPTLRNLNEMAPALLKDEADTTILDVPDALIALAKWPGQIKVIGPITGLQDMGVGFRKDSPQLRQAFNQFFAKINQDGTYQRLVQKYYPTVLDYYPDYFKRVSANQ
jgi:ABC-type amino acid transport substrate-binding protein